MRSYNVINESLNAVKWFQLKAEREFSEYTEGLRVFLEIKTSRNYRDTEKMKIFTGKQAVEYYFEYGWRGNNEPWFQTKV